MENIEPGSARIGNDEARALIGEPTGDRRADGGQPAGYDRMSISLRETRY